MFLFVDLRGIVFARHGQLRGRARDLAGDARFVWDWEGRLSGSRAWTNDRQVEALQSGFWGCCLVPTGRRPRICTSESHCNRSLRRYFKKLYNYGHVPCLGLAPRGPSPFPHDSDDDSDDDQSTTYEPYVFFFSWILWVLAVGC